MASSPQRNRTSRRLPDLLDEPLSFYEWTMSDWQRWAPDCIPDSLPSSLHDSISSDPPCLQLDDESLWTTFMELDEDAAAPAFDSLQDSLHVSISSDPPCLQLDDKSLWTTFMELDEDAVAAAFDTSMKLDEDAVVSAYGAFMELENVVAADPTSNYLQENHHLPPVGTHVAVNAGAGPSNQPQPQPQNLAPPPLVPLQNNNARAQQWRQQQQHPRMFPEDGPLRNIADLLNCRPSFLLTKKLTSTDTNPSQCRLSVPKTAVRANFKWPLFSQEDIDKFDSKDGLELTAFDQNGEEYEMRFKLWKSCGTYILLGKWKEFLQNNKLQGKEDAELYLFG